jgi:hypothetical protein
VRRSLVLQRLLDGPAADAADGGALQRSHVQAVGTEQSGRRLGIAAVLRLGEREQCGVPGTPPRRAGDQKGSRQREDQAPGSADPPHPASLLERYEPNAPAARPSVRMAAVGWADLPPR